MTTDKKIIAIVTIVLMGTFGVYSRYYSKNNNPGLNNYFNQYFEMGVAVSEHPRNGARISIFIAKFHIIITQNVMSMQSIHHLENQYYWEDWDKLINFSVKSGLKIGGHRFCRDE